VLGFADLPQEFPDDPSRRLLSSGQADRENDPGESETPRMLALAAFLLAQAPEAAWRALPEVAPIGNRVHTGAHVVRDRAGTTWSRPPVAYNEKAATGRKRAKVIVLIYDPVLESEGGRRLIASIDGTDPELASRILADVVREASWGYINYEIVDVIRVDGYPAKIDGFRYDDASYLEARRTQNWQPAQASYRKMFEENGLVERFKAEGITELWVWGADGFHIDEFAGFIPNRYARFGPTDNPWLYRPYDIPEELGRTTWVMGFNVQVATDNALHSYNHRVESMAALALADGVWDTKRRRDPWNVFSFLEMDHPGASSMVGNCHAPPNAERGYDYDNPRRVDSWAWLWARYPDLRGTPSPITPEAWGRTQFGYQKWLMERIPKFPGATKYGYNNWWLYVANTDEDLPEVPAIEVETFRLPDGFSAPSN
jgi:hypothetical protein